MIETVGMVVLGLTIAAFLFNSALLHGVDIMAWMLFGFYMYNQAWPAANPYLPTAIMFVSLAMVIVHTVKVITLYIGSRIEPPTHNSVQNEYRNRVAKITKRRKTEWFE